MKEIYFFVFPTIMCIYSFYKIYKEFSTKTNIEPDFFNVDIIDNEAQWVYNNKLYYAEIKNGKVDYSTRKEIVL